MLETIWAPWRAQYIRDSAGTAETVPPCFLCRALEERDDRSNLLVHRGDHSLVMLNRFPYNNGHLLVAPRAHRGRLDEFSGQELTEPIETIRSMIGILDILLRPHGYNVGLNLGKAAGAGLPGHLHWHIVPRWDGDTNFLPVLGNTKIIVESLYEFYDLLSREIGGTPAPDPATGAV